MRQPQKPIPSPFQSYIIKPGQGKVVLSILPPNNPNLTTLAYKYPLNLVARDSDLAPSSEPAVRSDTCPSHPVHLYLLTYGGGLFPGDHIELSITLESSTSMVVTTPQGSTRILKTKPNNGGIKPNVMNGHRNQMPANEHLSDISHQTLTVRIGLRAVFCYLPDPSVPLQDSSYNQIQTFTVNTTAKGDLCSSLCILNWVTQDRTSRGETRNFRFWRGCNEVWAQEEKTSKNWLLLRDSIILDDGNEVSYVSGSDGSDSDESKDEVGITNRKIHNGLESRVDMPPQELASFTPLNIIANRMRPHGAVGTLLLSGPVFEPLGSFFLRQFHAQSPVPKSPIGQKGDVKWTAACVRAGFVLIKFGAKDFGTARHWLGGLIREEGSVVREFGEEAISCL